MLLTQFSGQTYTFQDPRVGPFWDFCYTPLTSVDSAASYLFILALLPVLHTHCHYIVWQDMAIKERFVLLTLVVPDLLPHFEVPTAIPSPWSRGRILDTLATKLHSWPFAASCGHPATTYDIFSPSETGINLRCLAKRATEYNGFS